MRSAVAVDVSDQKVIYEQRRQDFRSTFFDTCAVINIADRSLR